MLAPLGTMARPARARQQLDLDLDGGVPTGVEDLAAHDLDDRAHVLSQRPLVTSVADVTSEPKRSIAPPWAFNPFEPGFADDPYPQYAELTATNPVQQTPLGPWVLFRYDDGVRLLRDPSLSVEDRSVVGANPRGRAARADPG